MSKQQGENNDMPSTDLSRRGYMPLDDDDDDEDDTGYDSAMRDAGDDSSKDMPSDDSNKEMPSDDDKQASSPRRTRRKSPPVAEGDAENVVMDGDQMMKAFADVQAEVAVEANTPVVKAIQELAGHMADLTRAINLQTAEIEGSRTENRQMQKAFTRWQTHVENEDLNDAPAPTAANAVGSVTSGQMLQKGSVGNPLSPVPIYTDGQQATLRKGFECAGIGISVDEIADAERYVRANLVVPAEIIGRIAKSVGISQTT